MNYETFKLLECQNFLQHCSLCLSFLLNNFDGHKIISRKNYFPVINM